MNRSHAPAFAQPTAYPPHPLDGLTQPPMPASSAQQASAVQGDVVNLETPLKSHAGEMRQIHLKPATFADYIDIGDVDSWVADSVNEAGQATNLRVETNYAAIMRWATRLSDIDQHILGTLKPRDAYRLMLAIKRIVAVFTKGN